MTTCWGARVAAFTRSRKSGFTRSGKSPRELFRNTSSPLPSRQPRRVIPPAAPAETVRHLNERFVKGFETPVLALNVASLSGSKRAPLTSQEFWRSPDNRETLAHRGESHLEHLQFPPRSATG
jgi:hypothetical protein